jgi:CRISPR-associated protein Csx17
MIIHPLDGCAPTPFAHYLKALGILRVVSDHEQGDSDARGWWSGDRYMFATRLRTDELLTFFLEKYRPTPMFNPWGARSGFYPGSSETTSRAVLEKIVNSNNERFSDYRNAINLVRTSLNQVTSGIKPSDKDNDGRRRLILALRRAARGSSSEWLDAVTAIVDTSERGIEQPAIFGTGGSEGSGSYTAAYMNALDECLFQRSWDDALRGTVFGAFSKPNQMWSEAFGQFLPNGIGSPWDLLLAFEGACLVRSSVATRSGRKGGRWLASPFFVAPAALGFSSGARIDEFVLNKGKELPGRGEQWFPLWSNPATKTEVLRLFVEGRALTSRRNVTDGWSMARAAVTLGVSQGIKKFVRFGYLQRNNQATHFAVPLGQITVMSSVSPHLSCLDDLDVWLPRLRREARLKQSPTRLNLAERRLSESLFALNLHSNEPARWQTVLQRLAQIESVQVTGAGYRAGPTPKLRPEWVQAADDRTSEFRLALAFALQCKGFTRDGLPIKGDSVRRHWLPLDGPRYATVGNGSQMRLQTRVDCVMHGRNGLDDAIAVIDRRLVEAEQRGTRRIPLVAAFRATASPSDIARFIAGEVDTDRVLQLARTLMALDKFAWAGSPCPPRPSSDPVESPDDAWLVIRLALLPWPLPDGRSIGTDPAITRRLVTGDVAAAVELARRRLRAANIITTIRTASASADVAKRWAAALAFPISRTTAASFVKRLDPIS